MAAPVTNVFTLVDASGCYSGQTLGLADQKAIDINLLVLQLAAIGGTNYTGNLNQLITDSACYATLLPDVLRQVNLQIDKLNAVTAGATVGTLEAQIVQAACIRNASKEQMDAALLFLKASLGVAKAYPQ